MRIALMLVMVVAATEARADDCEKFITKSKPTIKERNQGKDVSDADIAPFLEMCRSNEKSSEPTDLMKLKSCVLGAKDRRAVDSCWNKFLPAAAPFGNPDSPNTEAKIQLKRFMKNLKTLFTSDASYPKGKAGPEPAGKACCKQKGKKCAAGDWSREPWATLEVDMSEPTEFQYSYASDGKTAIVKAVGDLECDGKLETYTLTMSSKDGQPTYNLVEPKLKAVKKK